MTEYQPLTFYALHFLGGDMGPARGDARGDARGILKTHFKKIMLSLSLYCHVLSVGM
jgi:hypothetical protein